MFTVRKSAYSVKAPPCSRFSSLGRLITAVFFVTSTVCVYRISALQAQSVGGRWLQLQWFSGGVITHRDYSQQAQVGDRLSIPGHGITTRRQASANLAIDTGIGSVALAQNTQMTVQRLETLADGARITILEVARGQARIQARPLTNPNSQLELRTPSGVAAVRGTVFGAIVTEDGKTSIGTLEGQVEVIAQSVKVPISAGLATIILPGEPPTSPRALDRNLDIQWRKQERRGNSLSLAGHIDAANTLFRGQEEIPLDLMGYFEVEVPLSNRHRSVVFTVQNPLGESRDHRIVPWQLLELDGGSTRGRATAATVVALSHTDLQPPISSRPNATTVGISPELRYR